MTETELFPLRRQARIRAAGERATLDLWPRLDNRETNVDGLIRRHRERVTPTETEKRLDRLGAFYEHRPPMPSNVERWFRHRADRRWRRAVAAAFVIAGIGGARRERFDSCGAMAYVYANPETDDRAVGCWTCRDRWCPACGRSRGRRIAETLMPLIVPGRDRMITLTLKSDGKPLMTRLNRLLESFRRLRSQKVWKQNVTGAAYFVEIKLGKGGYGWHPHLHIIAAGSYVPKADLKRGWKSATGDSYIVDVRQIDTREEVARYVTKYVCKPVDESVYRRSGTLAMAIRALHGRHLCGMLGAWRGLELARPSRTLEGWLMVGRLDHLVADARRGNLAAVGLIGYLRGREAVELFAPAECLHAYDREHPPDEQPVRARSPGSNSRRGSPRAAVAVPLGPARST